MLTQTAILILAALLGNLAFTRVRLPGILGMISAGVLLGPSGFDMIAPEILAFLKETKTVALIVILIRAGLGINSRTLNRIGGPAVRMGFLPCLVEGVAVTAAAHLLLGLPFYAAGLLGFIIAAVSPAVVVPTMLELKEGGFGKEKEVPTLLLAGASLDNVTAITITGVFIGLAAGSSTGWGYLLLGVPAGVLLGLAIGAAIGFMLVYLFRRYPMRDTRKVIVFMLVAMVFYDLTQHPSLRALVPIAALLGIMATGFVILEKDNTLAHRLAAKFAKIWVLAEILLFVYIGAEVRVRDLSFDLVGVGLLLLAIGLAARSAGVGLALARSALSSRERLFCVIAYLPKATVQAAMGAVPLTMVLDGRMASMTEADGQTILALAVLSIVVTAPLGAIGIGVGGSRLLERTQA
jgi:NhaP-type Na+/H+ or K+/H+ antiporter